VKLLGGHVVVFARVAVDLIAEEGASHGRIQIQFGARPDANVSDLGVVGLLCELSVCIQRTDVLEDDAADLGISPLDADGAVTRGGRYAGIKAVEDEIAALDNLFV
jgi:hypothetical protein